MSFRVIVRGTPPARLVDVECHRCGLLLEDVWRDEIAPECPECHGASQLTEVFRSAPMIDFRNTKPLRIAGTNRTFESHREMERWAAANGKTAFTKSQWEQLPVDTPEERIEKTLGPKRREAIAKVAYKLKHGHMKPVKNPTESEVLKEP